MNVTLFKDLTTDEHLTELEANAEEYNGLYVDMEVSEQRKYVKGKAADIKDIIKRVNSARIKKSKDYRLLVETEASSIIARLEKANEPFTLLIEDYDAARKVILDAEKASKLAIEAAAQKVVDHEYAILLDKSYLADKLEAERLQFEHDEKIRVNAEENARLSIIRAKEVADQAVALDKANRLANKEHVRGINREILVSLMQAGIAEEDAKTVVSLAARKLAGNLTINY
ncbi:MAG: hypothetical protein IZT57_03790 [Chloroflexi bacterium]|nr:hypothetical protein [Chloroflexota bacterium]